MFINARKILFGFLLGAGLIAIPVFATSTFYPNAGGTGTSSTPAYGQVLVGTSAGIYTPTATSSLGLNSGSSVNDWGAFLNCFGQNCLTTSSSYPVLIRGNLAASGTLFSNSVSSSMIEASGLSLLRGGFISQASSTINSADLWGLSRIGNSTYGSLQHYFDLSISAGMSSGGAVTNNGDGTVAVAAGTGFIKAVDSDTTTQSFFNWAASSTISFTSATSTIYLGVEYNSGAPRVVRKATDSWDYDTEFPLAVASRESGSIYITNIPWKTADWATDVIERFDENAPIERDNRTGGLILSNTGTRNVAVTAGALLGRLSEFSVAAIDTSVASTFDAYFGTAGATKQSAQTQWNNSQYDNAGTLTSLTVLAYTSRWFYVMADGTLAMVYGTTQDLDFGDILDESPPSSLPDRIGKGGILIGRFIIRASGSTPTLTQTAFGTPFSSASVSSHTQLADLPWSSSGHTGTADSLASFNSAGVAISVATSTFNVGALTAATSLTLPLITNSLLWTSASGALTASTTGLVSAGTGISVTASRYVIGGALTVTNDGVTSISATSPLVNNLSTGAISLTCPTCSTFAYPFPGGATSSLMAFTGGLISSASSTFTSSLHVNGNLNASSTFYVAGSIMPGANNTTDIGSYPLSLKDVYVSGTLYIQNVAVATSLRIPASSSQTPNALGQIALDTTSDQLKVYDGSALQVFMPFSTMVGGYQTSTAWTGTTTLFIGPAVQALTVTEARCETNAGTVGVSLYDGTNRADYIATASTTINTFTYTTNNTFTANESMRVDIGNPGSSPTKATCRFKYKYTAD